MNAIQMLFYSALLWATRLELALAVPALLISLRCAAIVRRRTQHTPAQPRLF